MTWWLSDRADARGQSLSSAAQPQVFFNFLIFFIFFYCIEDMDNSYMKFFYTIWLVYLFFKILIS
jgi:hypothetical protein